VILLDIIKIRYEKTIITRQNMIKLMSLMVEGSNLVITWGNRINGTHSVNK
jgi:predicted DNA-binding WGR domain protein